jgi:stearoyl-CoA desaturase (delta-9 desaturase)
MAMSDGRTDSAYSRPSSLISTAHHTINKPNRTYIHYPALIFLAVAHLLALASLGYMYLYGVGAWEAVFHVSAMFAGGFGITALYHRAWAHNAVNFARPVEYVLATLSTFVMQMPARQWISTHIKHHQHTDHDDDPYNIQRGFWWAHFEWIIFAPVPPIELPERLTENPVVRWQERYYWPLVVLVNVVLPILISLAVGAPWWGGLLLTMLRIVLMSHAVFAVNSVCHLWGTRPFTKAVSARDVWWFPFVLGEQYHNYHHAFPRDYRHGVAWFAFDPTKWLIRGLAFLGLANDLQSMSIHGIEQAKARAAKTE